MNNVPWNLIRSFLVVIQHGSLSAAARKLAVSQSKLSRDIQTLEEKTQLNLFKRNTQGLILTKKGQSLVESANKMNHYAQSFNRKASGLSTELKGDVRISVNEIVGIYLMPHAIVAFNRLHPAVNIEILISNQTSSISKREADIALRMFRPSQPDLIAKRLSDIPLGFYAHENYIKKHGAPKNAAELKQHVIIGFDQSLEFIETAQSFGESFTRNDFNLRTDNLLMQINLARAEAGIVCTHKPLAEQCHKLQQILEWIPLPPLQFWVVCHADTQYNARIREFKSFLIKWFENDVPPTPHTCLRVCL